MSGILDVIQHYQRSIERSQDDGGRLLHCIHKLYKLPVKVEHLQDTGIGKTVNSLRKFNGEIGIAAKALVTKWKAMVAAEEEGVEPCHSGENHLKTTNGRRSSDEDRSNHDRKYLQHTVTSDDTRIGHKDAAKEPLKEKDRYESREHSERGHTEHTTHNGQSLKQKSHRSSHSLEKTEKHHNSRESSDSHHGVHKGKEKQRSNAIHSEHKDESEPKKKDRKERREHGEEKGKTDSSPSVHQKSRRSGTNTLKRKHAGSGDEHSCNPKERTDSHHDKEKKYSSSKSRDGKHSEKNHTEEKKTSSKHKKELKVVSSTIRHGSSSKSSSHTHKPSASSSIERKRRHGSENEVEDSCESKSKSTKARKFSNSREDEGDEGIDSSMGANFADVLGMLNMPTKKSKKTIHVSKSPNVTSNSHSSAASHSKSSGKDMPSCSLKTNGANPSSLILEKKPALLTSTVKLEPLDPSIALELPTISTNYKPMPLNKTVMECVFNTSNPSTSKTPARLLSDAEAITHGISSKTMRTKVYSGVKTGQIMQVPTLFDLCIRILQKNIDALEYTGGVPFDVLRPVLERATPQQLLLFEDYNPYLMEDSDILWQQHVARNYRTQKRQEMETWREMYLRCQEDQERKLNILAYNIKESQKTIAAPVRKTKLAYVDSMVKPPRNILRRQEQFGTQGKLTATPAARVAALSSMTPNAAKAGDVRLRVAASVRDTAQVSNAAVRPKKAPLMAKTLQFMRGRHKR